MSKIPTIMALFDKGFISEEEVVAWADDQIMKGKEPFDYITILSLKGPRYCQKLPEHEFPQSREFTFNEEFALRTKDLNVDLDEEKQRFLRWVSSECMGLDIQIPEVKFGYHIDHYFFECDDIMYANRYLKEQLSILVPKNEEIAEGIWAEIA
ncbi:MAG: hypothetical protein JAY90_17475 [Candidatus Thiodiazotropha lotti]|nr:hypothetical protein [Candidatus Thiodiazotropha lotti]